MSINDFTLQILREHLPEYATAFLTPSPNGGKGAYVCPFCGSGTGPRGSGAFHIKENENFFHCFSCEKSGDIFDLIGEIEEIPDFLGQCKRAAEIYGIPLDTSGSGARSAQKAQKKENRAPEATEDYNLFFEDAARNIGNTKYHRGISLATLKAYKVGYAEFWRHPKAPEYVTPTPRLIIPTSAGSYLARDTRPENEIPENQKKYKKSKVGQVELFNRAALGRAGQGPIFVVEGEIDALSIIDCGADAVGLGSISNINKLLAAVSDQKAAKDHLFILALDQDQRGQEKQKELKKGLEAKGVFSFIGNASGTHKDPNEYMNADREGFKNALEQITTAAQEAAENYKNALREEVERESAAYALGDFMKRVKASKNRKCFSTGFPWLDEILDGGLYTGLYILGAVSSLGKTTFCLQIADNIASNGQDVLIFSLEMARDEIIAKSLSRTTYEVALMLFDDKELKLPKTTRGILDGNRYDQYSKDEKDIILSAQTIYGRTAKHIYINEGVGDIGIDQITQKVKRHIAATGRRPVVLIDYLQIMAPADPRATDKQNTDKAVLELKRLSRDCDIPVIGISSFNRDNYKEPVNTASFKESGAIEYSSDVLIGLQYYGMDYQLGESEKDRNKRIRALIESQKAAANAGCPQDIEIKVLKNRNGRRGSTRLCFMPKFNSFANVDPEKFKYPNSNAVENEPLLGGGEQLEGWTKIEN